MTHEQDGSPLLSRHVIHLSETFLLKFGVADGQHLVNNQNFGLKVSRHRKCKADIHPGRIVLHRGVEKLLHLGKGDDLVELFADLALRHPEDGAVEKDVLSSGQFWMKASADLKQARDTAAQHDTPLGGVCDAAQY